MTGFCEQAYSKGVRVAKVRRKTNPLKAAVTVSPTEVAADAAVPEIARPNAARLLRPVQAECRRRRARRHKRTRRQFATARKRSRRAARAPTSLRPTAITMAQRPGAGLPTRSCSSQTTHRPDRCTDRNGPVTTTDGVAAVHPLPAPGFRRGNRGGGGRSR